MPPRAVELVVDSQIEWRRKLNPAEREEVIAQVLKATRKLGYRHQRQGVTSCP